jgi:hypothetical protein
MRLFFECARLDILSSKFDEFLENGNYDLNKKMDAFNENIQAILKALNITDKRI